MSFLSSPDLDQSSLSGPFLGSPSLRHGREISSDDDFSFGCVVVVAVGVGG